MAEQAEQFKQWCVVELMGHQRMAGWVVEQTIAGHGFLRVDVYGVEDDEPRLTRFVSPASLYAITPVTEDTARQAASAWHVPQPVKRWELPSRDEIDDEVDDF